MKHLFKKKIFIKIFLGSIAGVVISIILTSVALYVGFQKMAMNYEYKSKVARLESYKEEVSKLSKVAVNIGNYIYRDLTINPLLYSKNPNVFSMSTAFNQLENYRLSIPYIESIYIYNKFNDYIYIEAGDGYSELTVNGYSKQADGFADASANEIIDNFSEFKPFRPIPRIYEKKTPKEEKKHYYTYFIYDAYTKDTATSGVLVNFSTEYLLDSSETDGEYGSEIFIMDGLGRVISNNSSFIMMEDYSKETFIKKILADKESKGYFVDEIDEEKVLVVYSEEDAYGWRYVSVTNYAYLMKGIANMQLLTVLFNIVFVILGIIIAFLFTRKVYYPIGIMETDIKELQNEKRIAKNRLKRSYMSELLASKEIENPSSLKEYFHKLNMNIDFNKNLILILIQMDDYDVVSQVHDLEMIGLMKFSIINILNEILEEDYQTSGIDMGKRDILMFLNLKSETMTDISQLQEKLLQAKEIIKGYYDISFTSIISSVDKKADQLAAIYRQVTDASMHRIFYESGSILLADHLIVRQSSEYEYPVVKEKQLVEALMTGKSKEAKEIYQTMITNLVEYPISIYNMVIARLIVTINNTINIMKKNSFYSTFNYEDISLLLHKVELVNDLTERVYHLFDLVEKEMDKKRAEKQDVLIEQINEAIQNGYADINFSVQGIADSVGKSMPYISRIYMQYVGTSIIDKISEVRMEKARELIKKTDLSINEISGKVGFSSSSYFHRAFKKVHGVTPKEFREDAIEG